MKESKLSEICNSLRNNPILQVFTKDYRDEPEDVWVNPNVIDHVKGKKKTEIFKIPYGE